jgi:hypothetical protein
LNTNDRFPVTPVGPHLTGVGRSVDECYRNYEICDINKSQVQYQLFWGPYKNK